MTRPVDDDVSAAAPRLEDDLQGGTAAGEILWRPEPGARTRLAAFRRHLAYAGVRVGSGYGTLHAWSVAERGAFWRQLWDFTGVVGPPGAVDLLDADAMPGARFLPEARLNYAENLLRHRGGAVAVIGHDETGARETLSRDALRAAVFAAMADLEALGLGAGDRVAALAPNRIDTLVLMLAVTGLGGVWSSCSPDFGSGAALDRFTQVDPVLLVGCDGYRYGGRAFDVRPRLAEIAAGLPGVRDVLVMPVLESEPDLAPIPGARLFRRRTDGAERPFVDRAFDDPLYVMFSSGTTGAPKCIVHGVGGTLLQHLKEHQLHCDAGDGDALCFFTTCGWMMWNWLVSALASAVAVVLHDGSPTHPDPAVLLRHVETDGLTHLGVSPGWLGALEQAGVRPSETADLRSLRCLLSTGSPLAPHGFRWAADAFGDEVQVASITGGTDIMGCFALGCAELPVRAGEIQAPGLGMALAFLDEDGRAVRGRRGELVCTAPFPSMPVGFMNDADGSRYRAAYFDAHPGVWTHGDFGEFVVHDDDSPDGIVIHGRSDAVLNRGGVRIGTAELYRQAERVDGIVEALAIQRSVAPGGGDRGPARDEIVLFVTLEPGTVLDDGLRETLRRAIRSGASPRHVPDRIAAVPELPRTRSGKLVELAVREVVHGRAVRNAGALANPEALEAFRDHPDLA